MRVFHVISGIENGGVEMLLKRWIASMPRDIEFHIVLHEILAPRCADELSELGVILHVIPCRKRFLAHRRALRALFSEHHPDAVHVHTAEWGWLALEAARREGVSCRIQHSHAARREKNPIKRLFLSFSLRRSRCAATHFFACGEDAARWAFGTGSENGDVAVLKNGIDTKAFAYNGEVREQTRAALGLGEDTVAVGMIARFTKQKNHVAAIKIFKAFLEKNPRSVLLLVGDGRLLPRIKRLANRLLPMGAVRFLGVRNDVPSLLQAMDVFLLPSRFEGLPITLVEAQASGLPSVVSDTVTREVDFSGLVTFHDTGDVRGFAAALAACPKGEREQAHKLAAECGYSLDSTADRLYRFYRDQT